MPPGRGYKKPKKNVLDVPEKRERLTGQELAVTRGNALAPKVGLRRNLGLPPLMSTNPSADAPPKSVPRRRRKKPKKKR